MLKREITPLSEGRYLWWGRREGLGELLLSECAYNREILSLFRRIITFGGSLPFVRDLPTTLIATFGGLLLSLSGTGGEGGW